MIRVVVTDANLARVGDELGRLLAGHAELVWALDQDERMAALAEADVLVIPSGVEPGILAMARRDAGRLTPGEASPESLAALALAGRQVVQLITGPIDPHDLKALAEAGVVIEVLLAAPA